MRLSRRLTASPACLVADEHDLSPQMERMLAAAGAAAPHAKRVLELNADHEVVQRLRDRVASGELALVDDAAQALYGYALLAEGSPLPDPARFTKALAALLARSLA